MHSLFRGRAWLTMLHSLDLPPFNLHPSKLLEHNIDWIVKGGYQKKVPDLTCLITEFTSDLGDGIHPFCTKLIQLAACVTLRDPTGTIEGTVSRDVLEAHPDKFMKGSVITLKNVIHLLRSIDLQISVLNPTPKTHLLIITKSNVVQVIPPKVSYPPDTERVPHDFPILDCYSQDIQPPALREQDGGTPSRNTRYNIPPGVQQNLFPEVPEGTFSLHPFSCSRLPQCCKPATAPYATGHA